MGDFSIDLVGEWKGPLNIDHAARDHFNSLDDEAGAASVLSCQEKPIPRRWESPKALI